MNVNEALHRHSSIFAFLTLTLLVWSPSADALQWSLFSKRSSSASPADSPLSSPQLDDVPAFYIYDDPAMDTLKLLDGCEEEHPKWPSYVDVIPPLLMQLENHEKRVWKPEKAHWFIVPFDFDRNEAVGRCRGTGAESRVTAALDVLESSPFFTKSGGWDHVIFGMRYRIYPGAPFENHAYFPSERRKLLQNMTVGQYKDQHLNLGDKVYGFDALSGGSGGWWRMGFDWRCTWLLPIQSAQGLWKGDETFDEWFQRPLNIFFRGHGKRCGGPGAEDLRHSVAALDGVVPNIIMNNSHADTMDQYVQEITSSKFCLVMRCDDPQTSRLVDALAAGCIPVLISDGLDLVAKPFSMQVNYDAFTVNIPEGVWMKNPVVAARFAYNWPEMQMKRMHKALQAARQHLLWHHPQSDTATVALRELSQQC